MPGNRREWTCMKPWEALRVPVEADAAAFAWQEGYGVFSVSKSAEPSVKRYIESQPEHHEKRDFKEEFLALLRAHDVAFDQRFVFD